MKGVCGGGGASLVGLSGCLCSATDQNFQLCYSSASHSHLPKSPKEHGYEAGTGGLHAVQA